MKSETEKASITPLDLRLVISAMICYAIGMVVDDILGIKFYWKGYSLDILQKMTLCISCFLVCQDDTDTSLHAGITRLKITFIGGAVGVLVIALDELAQNSWAMILFLGAGLLLTLFLCKLAKIPYVNARIGCATVIFVSCTIASTGRFWYGVFRLVSTIFAVIVCTAVTWVCEKIAPEKA